MPALLTKDVQLAVRLLNRCISRPSILLARDVELQRGCCAATLAQSGGNLFGFLMVSRADDNVCTARREIATNLNAETSRGTSHERYPANQ